jgi:hypothetical protein
MIRCISIISLIILTFLSSCHEPKTEYTVTLPGDAARDGFVVYTGLGYMLWANTDYFTIGDNTSNWNYRGFVSFQNTIPAGSEIKSATLRVYLDSCDTGADDPFVVLGSVVADSLDYGTLDTTDYSLAGTLEGTLALSAAQGYKELDVKTAVQSAYNSDKTDFQFRVRHSNNTNNDATQQISTWNPSEASANKPELIVTYLK